MKFIVPFLGGLVTRYGYKNPWSTLYLTYSKLPPNNELLSIISQNIKVTEQIKKMFGALIIVVGTKEN
jgi:hypothetical protein